MENEFFLNLGNGTIPPSLVHFESTPSIDIQTPDCFLNSHHNFHFNSNSNPSNESFMIRELIGKLGSIGNSSVRKSMPLNSTVVGEFSADPGFAERAARLSCFGSRSFNGRNNNNSSSQLLQNYGSNSLIVNEGISRVSSSPSLKALGSELGFLQNKNSSNEMANSQDESTLSDQNPNGEKGLLNSRKRKAFSKGKLKEPPASSSPSKVVEVNDKSSSKRCKVAESNENEKGNVKNEEESKKNDGSGGEEKQTKTNSKPPEPPKDYIHVRARRGQATDSHSLAERVRREKISERMKLLQDLVPGCNKVTGKALMLDEIINYVQSLQHQVEFLSMKLASVNTRADFNMDSLISKEMYQSGNPLTHPQISPIDSSASAFYGQQQPQQNAALPSSSYGAPRATPHCSVDPLDSVLCQLPSLNPFTENPSQYPTFGEDDLQTIVQMGFVQNQNQEISLQSQNFNIGSDMKIEL